MINQVVYRASPTNKKFLYRMTYARFQKVSKIRNFLYRMTYVHFQRISMAVFCGLNLIRLGVPATT